MNLQIQKLSLFFKLKKIHPFWAFLLSSSFALVLMWLHIITGKEISFAIFYLIPISVAVQLANTRTGFFVSVFCTLLWLYTDIQETQEITSPTIPYINAFVRFSYFSLHTTLLSSVIKLYTQERNLALVDPLTHTANRRHFQETLDREIARSARNKRPLTIVYIDLDHFKKVNDTFGHERGDELLICISKEARAMIRTNDLLARLGGDEFALLLPETNSEQARPLIQRIQAKLLQDMRSQSMPVTFSIGCVTFHRFDLSNKEMIHHADNLMYEIKKSGKNRIEYLDYK